ncbi:MAG TPA: hypothetical protein VML95_10510 [Longimicrobiales bacterium]|nr:hypothetical protein [Longimicrobiales bacterium]
MSGTKARAEAILRELPSVVDAFVREDVYGDPREVHLLIRPGPEPRDLATDIRELLEERLGIPLDQRIISIAQLRVAAPDALPLLADGTGRTLALPAVEPPAGLPARGPVSMPSARVRPGARAFAEHAPAAEGERVTLTALEVRRESGKVIAAVRVERDGVECLGEATEPDLGLGPIRAAARAALQAVEVALEGALVLELESATVVRALDRAIVLVTSSALAPELGRNARQLAGAHAVDGRPESAAVLAALKATNRTAEVT